MSKQNRRSFITKGTFLTLAATVPSIAVNTKSILPPLVHHVFFWLKRPSSKEDRQKLIEGLKTLTAIEAVRQLHIGVPADTEKRPVVDSSYSVSELIFFDDLVSQRTYQEHAIHKKFVAENSHLWEKVVVYDAIVVN